MHKFLSRYFGFPLSLSFHQWSMFIHLSWTLYKLFNLIVIKQNPRNTWRRKRKICRKSLHTTSLSGLRTVLEQTERLVEGLHVCHIGLQLSVPRVSHEPIALCSTRVTWAYSSLFHACHIGLQLSVPRVSHEPVALCSTRVTLAYSSLFHACHISL